MVVLSVLAAIALLAAPFIDNFRANLRIKGASRDLHSNLEMAKFEAIKRNRNVLVELTPVSCPPPPTGGTYRMVVDNDKDGNIDLVAPNDDDALLLMNNMPINTALCQNPTLPNTTIFKFSPRGLWLDAANNPLGSDSDFNLQNENPNNPSDTRSYNVTVSIAGGIKTRKL